MITRFDHAVIGVADLEQAIRRYRELGFAVSPGGHHPGRGSCNAIIRFGLDYLELLAVADAVEATASGGNGRALVEFLRERDGGPLGYALATGDIAEDAERFRRTGMAADGPFAMQRLRPDDRLLAWRLLVPGGVSWRRPWPFLIQWDTPDDERLSWEQPGTHPNGATGVAGVVLAVHDLDRAIDLYQRQLDLRLGRRDEVSDFVARRATFSVGSRRIELLAPTGVGPVQRILAASGEGVFALMLTVESLEHTRAFFAQRAIDVEAPPGERATVHIPAHQTLGTRLVFNTADEA